LPEGAVRDPKRKGNSPRAVQMSVFVVRAFVKMRSAFGDSRELSRKLALLENELKIRWTFTRPLSWTSSSAS
jgi:hypothetical protein